MTLITKPDFTYVWASGGAVVAPNDSKKQLGWVAEAPPFQYDNWLQNRQDQMLAHINQRGIPAWDGLTDYEAGGLSYVQGSDGKVYKSVATSGPASVVSNPVTDVTDTYWTIAFADVGAFLTQAAGDTRYTQRSNNLSDLTNVAAARTNLALGTAATATLTTSNTDGTVGRVLKVGDGGWMGQGLDQVTPYGYPSSGDDVTNQTKAIRTITTDNGIVPYAAGIHFAVGDSWGRLRVSYNSPAAWIQGGLSSAGTGWTSQVVLSDNILQTTGSSTVFPMSQKAVSDQLLGVGQTWQDVTASRTTGTIYTNTTGRTIEVCLSASSGSALELYIDGFVNEVQIKRSQTDNSVATSRTVSLSMIVPPGATYRFSATYQVGFSFFKWVELR